MWCICQIMCFVMPTINSIAKGVAYTIIHVSRKQLSLAFKVRLYEIFPLTSGDKTSPIYQGQWRVYAICINRASLTLSSPVMSNGYSGPYWSNPPFLIFWHSGTRRSGVSVRVPECQKTKTGGLHQYGAERFSRLIFATVRKAWDWKG